MMCALAAAGAATTNTAQADEQSREDAWWTGPLLAANAATLPAGHLLFEPYLFDVITTGHLDTGGARHSGPYEHDIGSLSYLLYGLVDRVSIGLIPHFAYNEPAGQPNSSGVGIGDLTLQAAYGLLRFQDGRHTPDLSLVVQETLPTGAYDRLSRPSDGFGAGAYTTSLAVYSQDYFWMPNGRILRARLDVTYAVSSSVDVRDQSVYGTPYGFSGQAYPGDSFTADAAAEYSLTRNWVLALDVVYQHDETTRVSGTVPGASPAGFQSSSGSSYSIGFAPAVEYNWTARVGAIFGVRIIELGRNTATTVTPAIALNMVF
jgi:Putative MetA-pathway of phenol degradation